MSSEDVKGEKWKSEKMNRSLPQRLMDIAA